MLREKNLILLFCLLFFSLTASAQEEAAKAQSGGAGARKVTITLVRWPYT